MLGRDACTTRAGQAFTTGIYLNLDGDDSENNVRASLAPEKYAKLAALKAKWDPENLFRLTQNIKPRA